MTFAATPSSLDSTVYNEWGRTPLHEAVISGTCEDVIALLAAGADRSIRAAHYDAVSTYWAQKEGSPLQKRIKMTQAKVRIHHSLTPLGSAVILGRTDCVEALLEGVNPKAVGSLKFENDCYLPEKEGEQAESILATAIEIAITTLKTSKSAVNELKIIRLLVDHGALATDTDRKNFANAFPDQPTAYLEVGAAAAPSGGAGSGVAMAFGPGPGSDAPTPANTTAAPGAAHS